MAQQQVRLRASPPSAASFSRCLCSFAPLLLCSSAPLLLCSLLLAPCSLLLCPHPPDRSRRRGAQQSTRPLCFRSQPFWRHTSSWCAPSSASWAARSQSAAGGSRRPRRRSAPCGCRQCQHRRHLHRERRCRWPPARRWRRQLCQHGRLHQLQPRPQPPPHRFADVPCAATCMRED